MPLYRLASLGALAELKLDACWGTSAMALIPTAIIRGGLPCHLIT